MSKERARRRAEREAAAAREREIRARRQARRARRAALLSRVTSPLRRDRRRSVSLLARQRARQNGALLALLVPLHGALWIVESSWAWRGSALLLSVLVWPVLTVMLFDRRPAR